MTGSRILLSAALMWTCATPSAAQQRHAPVWQMDWGDQYCSLVRLPDAETPYAVALRALPGLGFSNLLLLARGSQRPPATIDSITLFPSGRSFEVSSNMEVVGDGSRAVSLRALPMTFWEALAGSDRLELRLGSRSVARIHLTQASPAVQALRRCVSDALREWGVDEAAMNALQRRPVSLNALGIDDQDYPREAIRQNIQGRVVVRIDVSAQGRATACAAVASSHTHVIDAAACNAALTRARFRPALDANGLPTAAQIVTTVTFLMPG
jgi:TonB family protein